MRVSVIVLLLSIISASAAFGGGDGKKSLKVNRKLSVTKTKAQPDFPGYLNIEYGIQSFTGGRPESLNLSTIPSYVFNVYYFYPIQLWDSKFSVNPGVGFAFDQFNFVQNNTLNAFTNENGRITEVIPASDLVGTDVDIRNSILSIHYFDIPVEVTFHTNKDDLRKSFRVALGAKFGLRTNSITRISFRENGDSNRFILDENFNLRAFRAQATARIAFGSFSFFGNYSIVDLFRPNAGPEGIGVGAWNAGVSIRLF